jgi:hypothetical protein
MEATIMTGPAGTTISVTDCPGCTRTAAYGDTWSWARKGKVLGIAYGNRQSGWPQMAALHMNTGALRMVYGPDSGWGPTVYVPPSLWVNKGTREVYHLGAPVTGTVKQDGADLVLDLNGRIGGLAFASVIRFRPPANNQFEARVSMTTSGSVKLAARPCEAFKPVHVATMKISSAQWDSQAVRVGGQGYPIPSKGWVLDPPGITGTGFRLVGGTSDWKPNGPGIAITLDRAMTLQGWTTHSTNPNDDNVGIWCASDTILEKWGFVVVATP